MIISTFQEESSRISAPEFVPPLMLTVDETAARFQIAKHFVRQCAANGSIVVIHAGRKLLINASSVERFLNTGEPQGKPLNSSAAESERVSHIAPIPARIDRII